MQESRKEKSAITINNMNELMSSEEFDVRADRETIFDNPFHIYDESESDAMCDKYEKYFYERIEKNGDFKREADRLVDIYKKYKKLNLFCRCYPKRCHSETIREIYFINRS